MSGEAMKSWNTKEVLEALASLDDEDLPDGFRDLRCDDFRLLRYPDQFVSPTLPPVQVVWSRTQRSLDATFDDISSVIREWGLDEFHWWVSSTTRPLETEAYLRSRGGVVSDSFHVLARELTQVREMSPPAGIEVIVVDDEKRLRDVVDLESRGWGRVMPNEDELQRRIRGLRADRDEGRVFQFVAYADGIAASTGICRVDGDVARLYGAVTLPEFRSRGCYHAVLGARLRIARDLGATIAITRGRPLTSGRLLVTSGFTVHDVDTCYRLSVA